MNELFKRLATETQGQDLIEYGLLIGIVTLGAITAIATIGSKIDAYFANLNATLP